MNWRKYFDETIISRGESYYRKGKVVDFSVDGLTRTATVVGGDEYKVSLTFSTEGELTDAICSCPYAERGEYCKHMVAVLIAEENGGVMPVSKTRSTSAKKEKTHTPLPPQEIRYCEESEADFSTFKAKITAIISGYKHRGFIEYRDAYPCALDISAEAEAVVSRKLFFGDYKGAFDCALFVMRKFSGTDMDDSDGGIVNVCGECIDYIEETIKDSTTEKYAFKKILSYLKKPNDKEWYAADLLEHFLLMHFDSPEYYETKLVYIDERIEREINQEIPYKLDDYLKAKLSIIRKSSADDETIKDFYKQYWRYASVEKDYIESAIASGNVKEAERVLIELLDFPHEFGLPSDYCREKLLEIYKSGGEKVKYRSVLYDFVAEEYDFGMEKYFELRNLYNECEWINIRGGLLEKIKKNNREYYPSILLKEDLKEKLLQFVLTENGLYLIQKYEKYLLEDYAEQVFEKYKKELNEQMAFAYTRDMYKDIVRTLRKISRLEGGKPFVKSLAEQWRIEYPRRRAMLEELDKLIIG